MVTASQVTTFINKKYGGIPQARKQLGIQSAAQIRAFATKELSQLKGETGAQQRQSDILAQSFERKAVTKAMEARARAVETARQIQQRKLQKTQQKQEEFFTREPVFKKEVTTATQIVGQEKTPSVIARETGIIPTGPTDILQFEKVTTLERQPKIPERPEFEKVTEQIIERKISGIGLDVKVPGVQAAPRPKITDVPSFFRDLSNRLEQISQKPVEFEAFPAQKQLAGIGAAGASFVSAVTRPIFDPIKTLKETATGAKLLVTEPVKTTKEIGKVFTETPAQFIGEIAGGVAFFKGAGVAGKVAIEAGKKTVIKTGAKFVPPEELFAKKVLEGKERLPTVKTVVQATKEFEKARTPLGDIEVITAAPERLKGQVAGPSRKGALGLEDPGVFVAPVGKGSPAFFRIGKETDLEFTLSPVEPIKQIFKTPTATVFTVKDVLRLPREVAKRPGFLAVEEFFLQEGRKAESAFITKRSEIGVGALQRQPFEVKQQFQAPFKLTVKREGKPVKVAAGELVKRKDILIEAGTTELEAVVPLGAQFRFQPKTLAGRIKGFEEFTIFEGKAIPIRRATLITDGIVSKGIKPSKKPKNKRREVIISSEKIISESKAISEKRFISPLSFPRLSSFGRPSKVSKVSKPKISKVKPSSVIDSRVSKTISSITTGKDIPSKITSTTSKEISSLSKVASQIGASSVVTGESLITTQISTPISPFLPRRGTSRRDKVRRPKVSFEQPKQFTPTAFAATFGVFGEEAKIGELSGLGLRPIKPKTKKKKKRS